MKKIIIIGAGASGMCCAINCKTDDNEVIILEKNSTCGKKILATGNGKCNYYNEDQDLKHYHSSSNIEGFLTSERISKVLPFFESIGIIPDIKDGYYYPKSNQAVSVKNALELECINKGVEIIYDTAVKSVEKADDKFVIKTNNGKYMADYLVVSTGSIAQVKNDGITGYDIASSFGHNIVEVLPGLVQLVANTKLKDASGVRIRSALTLYENSNKIKKEVGELQITDYGISGIVTMQLSSFISRGLKENKKEEIEINFFPGIENVKEFIESLNNKLHNRTISEILDGLINYKLGNVILRLSGIDNNEYYNDLSKDKQNVLINNLTKFKVVVESTKGFDSAQIASGGVDLKELSKNFESKLVNNLYFTGEVVDVNGDCGGYNLTFAWTSAIVVANHIKED